MSKPVEDDSTDVALRGIAFHEERLLRITSIMDQSTRLSQHFFAGLERVLALALNAPISVFVEQLMRQSEHCEEVRQNFP